MPAPEPVTPAAPVSTPAETADQGEIDIPEVVAKSPVIINVLTGQIPGVRVRPLYYPRAMELAKEAEAIVSMGLEFYGAQDGSTVLFNPVKISAEEIEAADAKGQLDKILPDYEKLTGEAPTEPPPGTPGFEQPAGEKLMSSKSSPKVASQLPASAATPAPIPAASQTKLQTARIKNMLPQAPTEGAAPVAGRIQRGLTRPAI
jgi:hypothetical protein